ncbi:MAG: hypothetical protein WC700_19850 [Gemmatimonadaceae bacterium]|jgi:hypothetical protein
MKAKINLSPVPKSKDVDILQTRPFCSTLCPQMKCVGGARLCYLTGKDSVRELTTMKFLDNMVVLRTTKCLMSEEGVDFPENEPGYFILEKHNKDIAKRVDELAKDVAELKSAESARYEDD